MSVLAHCGGYWLYCDGGSIAAVLLLLLLIRLSLKRSARRARQRAADLAVSRAPGRPTAQDEDRERS